MTAQQLRAEIMKRLAAAAAVLGTSAVADISPFWDTS